MPQRPREHQLEELSRRALANALPPGWVHRPVLPDDYGLDETVEIFDSDNHATGLSFHVQLKGTDQSDLDRARRSIRFTRTQADYYRSLPIPVLIVLFHAPTERLFARWFHAYNPHLAEGRGRERIRKTIGFPFGESDEWCSSTPDDLVAAVRGFKAFRSPSLDLPLRFSLSVDEAVTIHNAYDYAFALRSVLKPVADVMAVEPGPTHPGKAFISIGDAGSVVSLGDVASVTLDHDESALRDVDSHARNLAVGAALLFARVGQSDLASRVAAATAATSDLILNYDVVFTLAEAFARSRRVIDALRLSDALDERAADDEDAHISAFVLGTAALGRAGRLDENERQVAVEVAERTVRRAEQRGDASAAAAASYNLAMTHKGGRDDQRAIAAFRRAPELDPDYLNRAYYHRDIAGVLFESGQFADAAFHYGRAVELGDEPLTLALHADALLFSGRYAEAGELLNRYVEADLGPEGAEWRLKQAVLPTICATGGDVQDREPTEAKELAERVDFTGARGDMSIEDADATLSRALALDACCAEAWFRRSILRLGDDPSTHQAALEATIISAVLHRYAVGAWINAVLLARRLGEPDACVSDLARTAYRFNGDEFITELVGSIREADGSVEPGLLAILESAASEVDRRAARGGFTLRVPLDESVAEFVFQPE